MACTLARVPVHACSCSLQPSPRCASIHKGEPVANSPRLTNVVNQMEKDNKLIEDVCRCQVCARVNSPCVASGGGVRPRVVCAPRPVGARTIVYSLPTCSVLVDRSGPTSCNRSVKARRYVLCPCRRMSPLCLTMCVGVCIYVCVPVCRSLQHAGIWCLCMHTSAILIVPVRRVLLDYNIKYEPPAMCVARA